VRHLSCNWGDNIKLSGERRCEVGLTGSRQCPMAGFRHDSDESLGSYKSNECHEYVPNTLILKEDSNPWSRLR